MKKRRKESEPGRKDRPMAVWGDPTTRRRLRIAIASLGLLLALAAFLSYRIGLSASQGFSSGKALLFGVGSALFLVGILGRKTQRVYAAAGLLLLNILLLLVLVEASLLVWARIGDFRPDDGTPPSTHRSTQYLDDGREALPYYQNQDWARDFWREYVQVWDEQPREYRPYVIWRSDAFVGRALNIDEDGRRLTPGAECGPDSFTVFTLGGSTMWGTGVPDWGTIPAFLQAELASRLDRPVCVVNLSEQAYVSTQELIQLVLELRAKHVPDLVIFYDGINDVFAAYQSGVAGMPQNLSAIEAGFEHRPEVAPVLALASKLRSFRIAQRLLSGEAGGSSRATHLSSDIEPFAEAVVETYLGNCETIAALSEHYGFSYVFFWQPLLLLDPKPLATEEAAIKAVASGVYPQLVEFYAATYRRIREAATKLPRLYYIAEIFAAESELVYVDPWHVTMEGNEKIAHEMARIVMPVSDR